MEIRRRAQAVLRRTFLPSVVAVVAAFVALRSSTPDSRVAAEPSHTAALANDLQRLFADVSQTVRPSVVLISTTQTVETEDPTQPEVFLHGRRCHRQSSLGSGLVIDDRGFILTNSHVAGTGEDLSVKTWDGRSLKARLVQKEEGADIALLKVEPGALKAARLGNSETLKVGHWVLAIGSPFGLHQTVSAGIVSAVGRSNLGILPYESFIQTDASINHGNSGGPLVDLEGNVIGINTAIFSSSCGSSVGIGFAVPVNLARALVEKWIRGKSSSFLGIKPSRLDEDGARYFGIEEQHGILVEAVEADSPAALGGIRVKDVILTFNGIAVRDESHFRFLLAEAEANHPLRVELVRPSPSTEKGSTEKPVKIGIEITLTNHDLDPEGAADPSSTKQSVSMLGLTILPLTQESAKELSLPEGTVGLSIVEVEPAGPADAKGVRVGDVILEINERTVKELADVRPALDARSSEPSGRGVVMLKLLRESGDVGYKFLAR